jgi:hypothetical protein
LKQHPPEDGKKGYTTTSTPCQQINEFKNIYIQSTSKKICIEGNNATELMRIKLASITHLWGIHENIKNIDICQRAALLST